MDKRVIIIGDIHGCYLEFQALLDELNFSVEKDQLYLTGDILNRGPSPKKVYKLMKKTKAISVLGNHELHVLRALRKQGIKRIERLSRLRDEFGSLFYEFIEDLQTWPLYIENDDFLLVHAGLVPGVPVEKTDPAHLTTIRSWDGIGENLKDPDNPPWFDFYFGSKLVVFGHWAALGGIVNKRVIGLDTGCVYGKYLSALVFPEKHIISVPAQEAYCPIIPDVLLSPRCHERGEALNTK